MAIDILHDRLIGLRGACAIPYFRRRGTDRPCHLSTLYRAISRGTLAKDRVTTVKLEVIRTPSGACTSLEAIERFAAAINGAGAVTTGCHATNDAEDCSSNQEAGWLGPQKK
ncbi:MAG: hypothetical protein ABSH08_13920 [Tepidisphaeraceae bacterium]|jgi:hypothetical protein